MDQKPATLIGLETKFHQFSDEVSLNGTTIEGYASLFGVLDNGGDIVAKGAYSKSLARLQQEGRSIKMLWQHSPAEPIGIWEEVREDSRGLFVKGRLLEDVERAREAAALVNAGAIDGLSIGYKVIRATKNDQGQRILTELELWEVSLVTFPMLQGAKVDAKNDLSSDLLWKEVTRAFDAARHAIKLGKPRR